MNDIAATAKLALLIDGDNVSATYMPLIMREASQFGAVAVRRIYGQFKSGRMKSWQKLLDEYDLIAVNVSPLTRGKNATDMKLVIEAMEMLHGRQLDGICIASSDGDFMPLVERIRHNALAVYGFGAKKAPKAYQDAFDKFFPCDTLLAAEKKTPAQKSAPPRKPVNASPAKAAGKSAPKAKTAYEPIPEEVILAALAGSKDGWTSQSALGNLVRRAVPDFTPKKYGYRTMTDLIKAMTTLESKSEAGNRIFVRLKQP
jgi:NYN domain/OST-HTH/LOTUS domain